MYRDEPPQAPDEVLLFMVRTIAKAGFTIDHGTDQGFSDIGHMQKIVNERIQQGFWVRHVKQCALDTEHTLVTFVLARLTSPG